ncbi:DUF262 domain-containing protein [Pontibacter toksunensis]|uniref:DUF262 domain-containing protein n=1 Tax=Pontibacter toksunensis TaxID=1332631 RepID=A0ABW6BRJ2_9BACT
MTITATKPEGVIHKPESFKLSDIASWQLNSDKSPVDLPPLQRSFVWKVSQIEAVWDSLLRGFPVGAFLLSKSEDEKLFLLDGQQRATSIALGHYNPWTSSDTKFWSLKKANTPVVWIDLAPKDKTNTQKFVLRVVTQSHPWGYQRIDHSKPLSVSDRRNALDLFKVSSDNKTERYINLSNKITFPYDANLPVPLSFLIESISACDDANDRKNAFWKDRLLAMCEKYLPCKHIRTKYLNSELGYLEILKEVLYSEEFDEDIYNAIKHIQQVLIPGIVVDQQVLKAEDERTGERKDEEDSTLFVRLNSSGTRIAGEELIYSIYKASFPEAKGLVEGIAASYVAPSLVISLVSRLAYAELQSNYAERQSTYPSPMNVNDFRKRIQDNEFKSILKEYIGDLSASQEIPGKAKQIFDCAISILLSEDDVTIPPVLVKSIIRKSPELFLMLLHWIRLKDCQITINEKKRALASITALSWFCKDERKYVRAIWSHITHEEFWVRDVLQKPFYGSNDYLMYPLISPSALKEFLIENVVKGSTLRDKLYPDSNSDIANQYKYVLKHENSPEEDNRLANSIWNVFIKEVIRNRYLLLFAQRRYINNNFGDFNQMENLEDTNTPWDWDHIYPGSWANGKWYIHANTKFWTNTIGNLRAMALEDNRSESNHLAPKLRLVDVEKEIDVREDSFVKSNDWAYWLKIERRINHNNTEMVAVHLSAIINRLCNIYTEWYDILRIGVLFNFEDKVHAELKSIVA